MNHRTPSLDSEEVEAVSHGFMFLRQLGRGNYGCVHLAKDMRLQDGKYKHNANGTNAAPTEVLRSTVNMERMQGVLGSTGDLGTILANGRDGGLCVVKVSANREAKPGSHIEALQEARVLRKLRHPCIVQFMDSFLSADGDKLYIVMEYCDSGVLADRIKEAINEQQWIKEKKIMGWFSQLCSALDFLHRNKILHRDIKPDNVFMANGGASVKLGDFGFTRVLDDTNALALTRCGTPFYMSPEQCLGHPYNAKADAWASGIVLYELVTLQLPFNGKSLPELRQSILHQPPKRPPTHYSKGLCDLMLVLLQRTPSKRPSLQQVLGMPIVKQALHIFVQNNATTSASNTGDSAAGSDVVGRSGGGRARVPSFATSRRSPPSSALTQRRNQLQMQLVTTTQELHILQQRGGGTGTTRSSTKRSRQPTPKKNRRPPSEVDHTTNGETSSRTGRSGGDGSGGSSGGGSAAPRRGGRTYHEGKDDLLASTMSSLGGQPPLYKRRRSDGMENGGRGGKVSDVLDLEMDDGGARARELMGSLQDIKMQLYDTEMKLRKVTQKDVEKDSLKVTARHFAQSLNLDDSMDLTCMEGSVDMTVQSTENGNYGHRRGRGGRIHKGNRGHAFHQSGESTYSDDKFESDEDIIAEDLMDEDDSINDSIMVGSTSLSAIGKSMVQMGLDDSIDGDPLRLSLEMAGASSQLVHMTATPSGVMDMGSPVHREHRGGASKRNFSDEGSSAIRIRRK